jgi:hypothetical protein
MADLHDIKDRTPNQALIENLEKLLEDAKSGELRSVIWISGWDEDAVTHGWAVDWRNSPRRMLSELVMLQHDYIVNIGFKEGDTVLSKAFDVP